MIERKLKFFILILLGIIASHNSPAQPGSDQKSEAHKNTPIFSRLHTLSIHVRDTITHDSVFHFLIDRLDLPVYYSPLKYGTRKYAGVYAGNLVLEPCGPYSNFTYASNDFRAVFFGLTFEPFESISSSSEGLGERKIGHEEGDTYIYTKDTALCADNITLSFLDKGQERTEDERVMDSLLSVMEKNGGNGPGIVSVKEIWIGYKDNANLKIWKEVISPEKISNKKVWVKSNVEFHFIKSNIREVHGITFKVKSLQQAKEYLVKNNLPADYTKNKINLDKSGAFGLMISFTE
jgi:hypothetical protein